eukprot:6785450-Alexandrium_andersonii.AAC.1
MSSDHSTGSREHAGVGFALTKEARARLTFVRPAGSRLMALALREAAREVIFVAAYAPHAGYDQETRQNFFDDMAALIEELGGPRPVVVLGDLNAR